MQVHHLYPLPLRIQQLQQGMTLSYHTIFPIMLTYPSTLCRAAILLCKKKGLQKRRLQKIQTKKTKTKTTQQPNNQTTKQQQQQTTTTKQQQNNKNVSRRRKESCRKEDYADFDIDTGNRKRKSTFLQNNQP